MKSKLLKSLVALLGFGGLTSCFMAAAYGCPHADYIFNVEVLDEMSGEPIPNIKVSATYLDAYEPPFDYTDEQGLVQIKVSDIMPCNKHTLIFEDVDGPENGGEYSRYSVGIKSQKEDYKGGDGDWYEGTATHDITAYLSHKTVFVPTEEENN